MLMLCSNGLTSSALISYLATKIKYGKAALVVTADNVYKENNYHVKRCIDELNKLNLNVDIFDIDNQHINDLLSYDVVEFIGGNPYYLLKVLNEVNAKDVLKQIANEKILIGWSAGALVMTTSIGIINEFSPEMNEWNITDFKAMNLNNVQIVPHYSKFINKYNDFEERCNKYEQDNNCKLIRLNDGEGIVIENKKVVMIK